jgi:hypothetical protein
MNDKTNTEVATVVENAGNLIPMIDGKPNLLAYAIGQGASIETIEKMMDLQERNDKYEAQKLYTDAMNKFRADCPTVSKTKKGHNSKYAGLSESIDQIKGVMSANGLSHRWTTGQREGIVNVTCIVSHIGGHEESTTLSGEPDTSGSKNSIQAVGSTVSYLQRYTLFAALGIAAGDEDTDGNVINLAELQEAIKAHFDTIVSIKHGIRDGDLYSAGEAWYELSEAEMRSLWVAPSKGGIFTTEERKVIKEDLRAAYYNKAESVD